MSTKLRLSRSKSRSPQHSPTSSPKRRPLHERSHSETNSIAGSASTGPPPIPDDGDPVYSSSPFPRLPSQVLFPKNGSPFIFEDSTAAGASKENARAPSVPLRGSSRRNPKSPAGSIKGRRSPRHSPRTSLEAARRPPSVTGRYGRPSARDLTRPLDEVRRLPPARTNSRVRSIVSAIEASSVKSQSPPATPKSPRTRSRASRTSITSRRYDVGSPDAQAILEENAPTLQRSSHMLSFSRTRRDTRPDSPVIPINEGSSELSSQQPASSTDQRAVSDDARPTTAASSRLGNRPRSSSAPGSPTETFLAALIASGAIQYPSLERPSATTLRTDTSSLRQAIPQPLQLRRQPARSNLALAEAADAAAAAEGAQSPVSVFEEDDLGDNRLSIVSYDAPSTRPSTPRHQIIVHPPSSGRWTPGRWDSEMEDDVPELQPSLLRGQRSWRDSWNGSQTDLRRSESIASFRSGSSTSLPFYNFLNDSKTAWARSYYRGEGAIRLMTPPSVTMIRNMSTRSARSAISAITPPSRHSRSASDSGADHTPDSASYAQEVFIPRIRPFQNQLRLPQKRLPPVPVQTDETDYTEYGVDDHVPTPVIVERSSEQDPREVTRLPDELHPQSENPHRYYGYFPAPPNRPQTPPNLHPTEPAPFLSPDRGNDDRISIWRPPSIEPESIFGLVNRQIFLFCLGFCFPFAWMIAAFLALPEKPPVLEDVEGRRASSTFELNEMFTQQEVRRYQKGYVWRIINRAMSVVGTFVIAAIIALAIVATR